MSTCFRLNDSSTMGMVDELSEPCLSQDIDVVLCDEKHTHTHTQIRSAVPSLDSTFDLSLL